MSCRSGAFALVAVTHLFLASGSVAQEIPNLLEQQTDTARSEQRIAEPAPIPVERAPRRFEQDTDRLRQFRLDMSRVRSEAPSQDQLDGIVQAADALLERFGASPLQSLHSNDLQEYRQSLEREKDVLAERGNELERLLREIESDQEELQDIQAEWELTRDSLAQESLSVPTFETSIARVLRAVDTTRVGLNDLLIELLDTGDELARAEGRIDTALSRIDDALAKRRRQLLVRESPPLWRPSALLAEHEPFVGDIGSFIASDARALRDLSRADQDRVLIHVLLFLIMIALFVRFHTRSEEWPEIPSLETARHMLSRPYSAAALAALLATNWVYPHASFLLFDAALLLSVIPVARLLPPLMVRENRPVLFSLLGLFIASRLTTFLPPGSLVHRLAVLGLGIALAVWSLAALRRSLDEADEGRLVQGGWRKVVSTALRAGLVLATLSVLLNIAGWAGLSETIVLGLIPSGYVAIVVALAAMLLIGVSRGIAESPLLNRLKAFHDNRARVLGFVTALIKIVAVLLWVWGVVSWFGVDREVLAGVDSFLTNEYSIGAVDLSIGGILLFGIILWLATWASRIVRVVLRDDVLAGLSIPLGQADAWATLAQWAVLVIGILFAAASAGVGGGQLAVLAGALGVGIGFGLQNIVNNFVSGFILIFEQPIKVGDKIEISSLSLLGDVRRIGVRSSTIHTLDGADVVVPNSNLIQSEVINWTLYDTRRRFTVDVGVRYGTDPQRVIDLLLEIATGHPKVMNHPAPAAVFMGFGDSSLNFSLRSWAATFDESISVRSEITVAVNNALKVAGIEIPFPQRDLHLRSVAPEARGGLPADAEEPDPSPSAADTPEEPDSPG